MNTTEYVQDFLDRVESDGSVRVAHYEVGLLVTSLTIVGGGCDCIVFAADGLIVRLCKRNGEWVAEHLIVGGDRW